MGTERLEYFESSFGELQDVLQASRRRPHVILSDGANGIQAIEAFQAACGADLLCVFASGDTMLSSFSLLKNPTALT